MEMDPGTDVSQMNLAVDYGTWPQVVLVVSTPSECTQGKLHASVARQKH